MPSRTTSKISAQGERGAPMSKSAVIPVIQERATVKKRVVETGRVRISKQVREYEEHLDIPHVREEVHVDRVPIDKIVDSAPEVRTEGDVTIIPILEERYVVEKRIVLVEELHVSRVRHETHRPETVRVLREEVDVKKIAPGDGAGTRKVRAAAKPRRQS